MDSEAAVKKRRGGGSVDPAEVERFDRLAADWWSLDGPMHALHRMNPVRLAWLRDHIAVHFPLADGAIRNPADEGVLSGLRILDIGCGGGILSESLARLGATVTGLEPSERNRAIARDHAAGEGLSIDYRADTAEEMAAAGHTFDAVCAMEVVEHVTDPAAFLTAAGALVRPGGLFFASTLNRTLKSFGLAIIGAEYILRWVPQGTHQWEKFVTPAELDAWVREAGLHPSATSGIVFNPLLNAWRLSGDTSVNYMLAARRRR